MKTKHAITKEQAAKHTPGPWKLDGVWGLVIGPKGQEICAIHARLPEVPTEQAKENARLIAAAPDLLEACRKLLAFLESTIIKGPAVDELRAAIDKAEGDTHDQR